ncbi:MAG TPA: HAMP domain-containing sensor histidine kinase [Vicinamibacterales bacterium]|nr:HAMP domain-containing sensor histidine kinase [Vicinamibacterales bacterium]
MRSSLPLRLIVPASLVLLVATLATLQYRWLGQVSEAERDRLRASLSQRAAEFADDFDREIVRLYLGLQVDGAALDRGEWTAFAKSYDAWRESARFPEMVRAVYLVNGSAPEQAARKYDPETHAFVAASWPVSLAPVAERLAKVNASSIVTPTPPPPPPPAPGRMTASQTAQVVALEQLSHFVTGRDPIVASVPAVIISMPRIDRPEVTSDRPTMVSVRMGQNVVVAELDAAYLTGTVLPTLVERYFPARDADTYRFAVVDSTDRSRMVYARGVPDGASIDATHADAMMPLFAIRPELATQVGTRTWMAQSALGTFSAPVATVRGAAERRSSVGGTVSIFVESRGTATNDVIKFTGVNAPWQLRLQHTAGSLDAAVNAARRRNLWLSFGILTVLAASVMLIVLNAQRWQRLAAQQMDFVATVSHELRTPLTVIRSAAQNLSAGVVHDTAQARQYGDLIETEGRRLTDMVEQVLEYAGLSGNRRPMAARPVDVPSLVREVMSSSASLVDADHLEVEVDVPDQLPLVVADEGAIRRAIQNLLTNAVKYGADGRWIGVSAQYASGRDEVQISVSDRGRGIDPEDLAHIFEPFYRGRYALDRQIHGNGLGLSLVQRIADAHGGRVTVKSAPGEGTTFTIHLPAARPDAAADPLSHPAPQAGSSAH